jgi:enamine deaminase RidA (YjgF/YER057c/UK114 family)
MMSLTSAAGVAIATAAILGSVAAVNVEPPAPAPKTIIIPAGMDGAYDNVHYAPAVRVGDTVYVSGIPVGGPGTFEEQSRRMFDRLKATLEAAGATMEDVVELESFHHAGPDTPAFQAQFQQFRAIHDEYFKDHYPAWTAIGNATLLSPNAAIELRAVAVIGSGKDATIQRAK